MRNRLSGFTLIEILIVIAIIAILASIIILANVNSTFKKTRDSKRKQDLNKLARSLEDYYNDSQQYPPANSPANGKIAGSPWGSTFGKYVAELPKDPLSPGVDYYYQVGPNGIFFVLYARLENTSDPDIERVGCKDGCGPTGADGNRIYNYLVSSGDVIMAYGAPNGVEPGPATPPAVLSLTPTINLTPPASPNDLCNHNQCCLNHWCGAFSTQQGGHYCAQTEKCWLNQSSLWVCSCATQPCNNPYPACQ
ncbi:prepilin-type N-terminal cleavage/methylation domain-containing protein [Candidatus Gottesmanbacteria bacterium]|nr:prepilin-type N-terminal cleavage/methylation domain-containing protein [Candidatus Gottesmanbacteria bacterium]